MTELVARPDAEPGVSARARSGSRCHDQAFLAPNRPHTPSSPEAGTATPRTESPTVSTRVPASLAHLYSTWSDNLPPLPSMPPFLRDFAQRLQHHAAQFEHGLLPMPEDDDEDDEEDDEEGEEESEPPVAFPARLSGLLSAPFMSDGGPLSLFASDGGPLSLFASDSDAVSLFAQERPGQDVGTTLDHIEMAREGQSRKPSHTSPLSPQEQADMRRRLVAIQQNPSLTEREKARAMQQVLTERYVQAQAALPDEQALHDERPRGALSLRDITKTFYNEELNILGCKHYRRKCKLRCAQCHVWTSCRFCHDEHEGQGRVAGIPPHSLPRKDTAEMLCMMCLTAQPVAQDCRRCHTRMAAYYCEKCKLWDDMPHKPIYHCNDCGICRVGHGLGKDYFHCKTCNVCMAISLEGSHRCIERSTECNCPICDEWMFSSVETVVFMPCGHSIHQSCYDQYTRTNYRCPTCFKTLGNMDYTFRLLDLEIARQEMPSPYNTWVACILCNDCHARSEVPHHFLGHKCSACQSYNTAVQSMEKPEEGQNGASTAAGNGISTRARTDTVSTIGSSSTAMTTADGPRTQRRRQTSIVPAIADAMTSGLLDLQDSSRRSEATEPPTRTNSFVRQLGGVDDGAAMATALEETSGEPAADTAGQSVYDVGVRALIGHFGMSALLSGAAGTSAEESVWRDRDGGDEEDDDEEENMMGSPFNPDDVWCR